MYSENNSQYVLKQSSGKVWNFFYDDRHGICYSTMTRRRTWAEPVSLQRNAHSYFYIDLDYEDHFHLLFQDRNGNILYSYIENENIKTIPLLNSRTKSIYNKYFYLIPSKNNIQLFYVIEHNDQQILAHQQIVDGKPGNPRVIDYVTHSSVPYTVATDRNGAIYAYYQASDSKYLQLGYRKYTPGQKFWSEFTPITRYNGDCELPRVICDINSVMHICYQRRSEKHFELVYQQKIPDRNLWSEEIVISSSAYSFINNAILFANNNLFIYWVRENTIYFSSSSDNGSTWTKPARLNFTTGRQLFCFNYKTNYPYENDKIIARTVPGNFINGFTLAFYEDSSSNIYNLSADELRSMIVDTLKLLNTNMEEMRETISNMKASITELKVAQQHLEKEVSKYSIKMTLSGNRPYKTKQTRNDLNQNFKDANITDEEAFELMKAEFLAEAKSDTDTDSIMEKDSFDDNALANFAYNDAKKTTEQKKYNESAGRSIDSQKRDIEPEEFDIQSEAEDVEPEEFDVEYEDEDLEPEEYDVEYENEDLEPDDADD